MGKLKDAAAYLRTLEPDIRVIAAKLRATIRAAAPRLEERIKYGFPHYDLGGTVVYIMDAKDHVNLGFYDGVDLNDPKGLLEGTGKRLRHVKVRSVAEAARPALKALVKEAYALRAKS